LVVEFAFLYVLKMLSKPENNYSPLINKYQAGKKFLPFLFYSVAQLQRILELT